MSGRARLVVEPADALADEPLSVRIEGLAPGERVTLRAETESLFCVNGDPRRSYGLPRWTAQAAFAAGPCGDVDLDRDAPLKGDWHAACGSAPLYALRPCDAPDRRARRRAPRALADVPLPHDCTVRLVATREDGATLEAACTRRMLALGTAVRDTADEGFVARFFSPAAEGPRPAVVVLSGSEGRIEKAQAIAGLFAAHGFRALALCYFGLEGAARHLDRIPLETVERACRWLQDRPDVDARRIGAFGRSKGGEMALAAASLVPAITCVVANAPSPVCYEGLRGSLPTRRSSWTWRGRELPCAKIPLSALARAPFARAARPDGFTAWLYDVTLARADLERVRFPIERINGPILLTTSDDDEVWPARLHGELAMEALDAAGFPHAREHRCLEGGCHTMTIPFQPAPALPAGVDVDAWARATEAAWRATLAFLSEEGQGAARRPARA